MGKDFLNDLNKVQQQAVVDYEGPGLVIAGAGSGKTRVLTYRIAYLLSQGIHPYQILALTFTNKAAREMKDRIGKLVDFQKAKHLWMGTFHSIFARILRSEGHHLGYPSNYTIYDTDDSRSLVKKIIKELELNDKLYKPGEIFGRISWSKNNLVTPAAYAASAQLLESDRRSRRPRISDIYTLYMQRCKKADAMDFDDLLLNMHILMRDFPEVLKRYQQQFSFVLVDEYQDTNYVQYMIVNQLAALHKNLCVVGDDAQSIYSFRGARIENILNFKHDFPGHKLYKLEQNYRSTQNIVNAANSLIEHNRDQISKKIWSAGADGDKIRLLQASTDNEEGYLVGNMIQDAIYSKHLKNSDISILYRTNAQSRIFEEVLRKLNIPYKIYGGLSFYQRREIKDLLAYFRLCVNPYDEEALRRIINYPARGIGQTTVNRLAEKSAASGRRMWTVLQEVGDDPAPFNQGTVRRLQAFASLINGYREKLKTMEAFDLAFHIAESAGILKDLHYENTPENLSRYENIQEILNGIREYVDSQEDPELRGLDSFLQSVALLTDQDNEKAEDRNKVTLMTVHASKGLEFKWVFVTGLEEELFPSRLSFDTREELEEERRLFYVAITRAMQQVVLSYAASRYRWGVPVNGVPSRFIREIREEYMDQPLVESPAPSGVGGFQRRTQAERVNPLTGKNAGMKPVRQVRATEPTADFTPDDPGRIQVGMEVEHPRFGQGKILNLDGDPGNRKATVFFQAHGQKQLLLKFARLKILS